MASSFITKDNVYGFWINDSLMQVVCWGLVKIIDTTSTNDENFWLKNQHREIIYNNSQGIFIGFMHLDLDEFLITEGQKKLFSDIIFKTKIFFISKGEYITTKDLNDFQSIPETKREWLSPLETKRIIKILNYLDDLINDKITIRASDVIDYEF